MLLSYIDYIFVHLRQKARIWPELSPKFLSTLGPHPTRKARPELQLWGTEIRGVRFFETTVFCDIYSLDFRVYLWIRRSNKQLTLISSAYLRNVEPLKEQVFTKQIRWKKVLRKG